MRPIYDYTKIQKLIDAGNSYRTLRTLLGISLRTLWLAKKAGKIVFPEKNQQRLYSLGVNKHHTPTEEEKNHLSILACQRLQKHSKYSKNIEYKPGIILESSYEVRVAEILDRLDIKWEKVRRGYVWNDQGKTRRYIPDFFLPGYDLFLDPKNDYLIKKDKTKIDSAMELNGIRVIVLSDKEITESFIRNLLP